MNHTSAEPRWPLWIWGLQLVPACGLSAYSIWRVCAALVFDSPSWTALVALCIAAAWVAVVLAGLLTGSSRRWLVEHRHNWGLDAVSTVVCLAIADVVLTATGAVPTIEYRRARSVAYTFGPFSSYRLVPNKIIVDGAPPIHINARGFRGAEIDPHKPESRTRIVFLGGSQVFDFHGGGWPERVGDLLKARGRDVDVVNADVPGNSSVDALANLLTDIWILSPDVVFVCNAWNYIKHFARLNPAAPLRGLPPDEPVSWQRDWRMYPSGIDRVLAASAIYRRIREGLVASLITEEGYKPWDRELTTGLPKIPMYSGGGGRVSTG